MPLEEYAELVLSVVERIPPGRVMAYGDIAELIGSGGPRQVGAVMARYGGAVPWWRVLRADGTPHDKNTGEAIRRLRAEGVPFRGPRSDRVDMRAARWDGSVQQPAG
ncbi:MAG TPA: MGMT family protein [Actinopolymorphaceae bacterium]